MRRSPASFLAPAALATALAVGACSADTTTSTSATAAGSASASTTTAGASGASGTAATAKVSANTASAAAITAALDAAGVANAERWTDEIVEYRPYPTDDPNLTKLRDELAKYEPPAGTIDQIVAVLEP